MVRDPHQVRCTFLHRAEQLPDLTHALEAATHVAIDTEVPIAGPGAGEMRVMSIACRDRSRVERSFVIDARDLQATLLAPILTGVTATAWNANFDARVVDAAVWNSPHTTTGLRWWDAQLADALLHQGQSGFTWFHGLAWASQHYLGIEVEGKGTVQLSYTQSEDLTEDQIAYAAADAVETLWVSDAIGAAVRAARLDEVCEIEMAARPFLDQMERTGLPVDWQGWEEELAHIETQNRRVVGELAALTGGGQGTLFDAVVEPTWNPSSDRQVRQALNRWSQDEVHAWTTRRFGTARALGETDSVTATVLREIAGPLAETLLAFRNHSKVLTTYGDSIREHLDDDGRLRPQYLQVVGTNTGRLASRNPNAQNLTPRLKPYLKPPSSDRVFVHADLSQAELRYLAQVADDAPLRAAFARGEDVHVTTAASMFDFEPDRLKENDPTRFAHLRQIAKALNFGIAYGTGAAALSRSLTAEGTETSVDEAAELLAQYRRTYPGTARWAEGRIAEIQQFSNETAAIDWIPTMRLARGFNQVSDIRRAFRRTNNRWPSVAEIGELHSGLSSDPSSPAALHDEIEWLMQYAAPVALLSDGEPFTFASRTGSGRRQQFNLHLDRLFLGVVVGTAKSASTEVRRMRQRFATEHGLSSENLSLGAHGDIETEGQLTKLFEDRSLRRRYIDEMFGELGHDATAQWLQRSAKERVSAMVNAWRNAPIQGGVADIMLVAYGELATRLANFPGAEPVQTVHDSIVVECDLDDADRVACEVRSALELASLRYCPAITPKADVDIRSSLAESDIIREL